MRVLGVFLLINLFFSCENTSFPIDIYSRTVGFSLDKPTLIINPDNCSACFNEFASSVRKFQDKGFNVVIISKERKKANLMVNLDSSNVYYDSGDLSFELKILHSLPRIYFCDHPVIEVVSPFIIEGYINESN
ncbi:hypothetical protein [Litoribacter populi]|uniref:hypothetical protein n=1 Tax=Litoribacter populi TaxID=2598460 RepID=UPI001180FEE9|nr:hypothetical protein [Litoribacter populi]